MQSPAFFMQSPAFFTQPPIGLEIPFSGPRARSQRARRAERLVGRLDQRMHVQSGLTGFTHALARQPGTLALGR